MEQDPAIRFNNERWDELARNGVLFSRPWNELTAGTARERLDPQGVLSDVKGKKVLCLASGGGQQSLAFSLLDASVTVIDFSVEQLERDCESAARRGYEIVTIHGDMRDLSMLEDGSFDIVWQPPSINYVPEAGRVISEAARVLTPGGYYFLEFSSPVTMGLDERSWDGNGYPLNRFYIDGEMVEQDFDEWEIWNEAGQRRLVAGPRQYRHTLSTIFNVLARNRFHIERLWEHVGDRSAASGTWEHFTAIAPSTIGVWCVRANSPNSKRVHQNSKRI
jgi:ubiquinone/menaquinone biosynthesis C-methylase UbiE